MTANPVIRVEGLGKEYLIGRRAEVGATFRDMLANAVAAPFRRLQTLGGKAELPERIWALRDVSFTVAEGEIVGIIGRNGAGKSTLLKILSRITEPTEGRAQIRGRIASLLEVGTGFHPELSGRENVYLNGAILGMSHRAIDARFDSIVDFAGVEKFIDTPVKRYSSGMYVRLAFAVAAHLDCEILVIDEVLAVGDFEFQEKCLGKMSQIAGGGRTILLVSHNMAAVRKLCERAILIRDGRIAIDGEVGEVVGAYLGGEDVAEGKFNPAGRHQDPEKVRIENAFIERDGTRTGALLFGEGAVLLIVVEVLAPARFSVELLLRQADGIPVAFAPSGLAQDFEVTAETGRLVLRAQLPSTGLAIGKYSIDIILAETGRRFYDYVEQAISFSVANAAIGRRNWEFAQARGQGHQLWDVKFEVANVSADCLPG